MRIYAFNVFFSFLSSIIGDNMFLKNKDPQIDMKDLLNSTTHGSSSGNQSESCIGIEDQKLDIK
jgi:hypothetical protein